MDPRVKKLFFAVLAIVMVLGAAEGLLRAVGFRYQRVTTYLEFNYPRPGFLKAFFEIDPDLLYRIRPTVKQRGVDLTFQPAFDLKIRDHRTFAAEHPGRLRVIALGDSSTYGVNTRRPWPSRLQEALDRGAGGRFEVINLGVPGYTSFQGRRVLETRAARLQPDVVVVYFGWNDHLLALGFSDAEQKVGSAGVVATRNLLSSSRLYQALSWSIFRLRGTGRGELERRVGLDDYVAELSSMVEVAAGLGSRVMLCTYPTALTVLEASGEAPPDWLLDTHLDGGSLRDLVTLQDEYNDIVRRLAGETGSTLVDLDAAFQAEDPATLFADPAGDMIHPNERGYDRIAALVLQALLSGPGE